MNDLVDAEFDTHPEYISKSRISTFKWCPLKYKKNYIDGIRDNSPNHSLAIGTRFHAFADTLIKVVTDKEIPYSRWYELIHPDYSEYEKEMLTWFIDQEIDRLSEFNFDIDKWKPAATEYKVVNHKYGLRGIIDRIDIIDDLMIINEYKTSKSIIDQNLQQEFGFYKLLLSEDERFNKFTNVIGRVIAPRIKEVKMLTPSKETTILRNIEKLQNAINSGIFEPTCAEFKMSYCGNICTIEESKLYEPKEKKWATASKESKNNVGDKHD